MGFPYLLCHTEILDSPHIFWEVYKGHWAQDYISVLPFILRQSGSRREQSLKDMMRACTMEFKEALYGRRCRSQVYWDIEGLRQLEGPELVQETVEKIKIVKKYLKAAQDRQKSYADKHRREMEYEIGDKVFLKVSPWKGILRFGRQGKLSPRYIGPYEIIERIGPLAYRLALPSELSQIHDVFHISMLRRYRSDPSHVLREPEIEISRVDVCGRANGDFRQKCKEVEK
ncbi:UNVERIFIED_CONTAM: hypothetical protein Slati_1678100 [Sesamum latifolium]|uniref:Tf2-1-like SH3-like domain-containing protein n=1 Tax=Sesamum latifolium TaxID=2727402 RepID=A0AAW2WYR6_9LAMI